MGKIEEDFLKDLQLLTGVGDWKTEYVPCLLRKWRIDVASVRLKISIEIEGERHGSAGQRRSDSEKQNFQAARGWKCLRYPASCVLNKKRRERILLQIYRIVCGVEDGLEDSRVLKGD